MAVDHEKIIYPTEYVHPVDESEVIPLPFISLRGKLIRHTFPGVPNYESIEDGDYPEIRWVVEVTGAEIARLIGLNYFTENLYSPDQEGWIQLIAPDNIESLLPFLNKQVVVKGYLGTLISHIHTPVTIEAKEIYDDS